LQLDSDKLSTALTNSVSDTATFFAGENGLAKALEARLKGYLQSDGTFDSRTDSINTQMAKIDDDRESLSRRLTSLEARLFSQFNAMDAIVAQLSSTGDFLTQQLESISQISKSRNKN
jgi:flagellar hook-associated protein 2